MAPTNNLCSYCEKVSFNPNRLKRLQQGVEKSTHVRSLVTKNSGVHLIWNLGLAGRIRKCTDCPFCRLIALVLFKTARIDQKSPIPDGSHVELAWSSNRGPLVDDSFHVKFLKPGSEQHLRLVPDMNICFVADSSTTMDLALNLLPDRGKVIDFERVKKWISGCTTTHGDDCHAMATNQPIAAIFPGLTVLRLVDVHNNHVIETTATCRYVTLSYLWGLTVNFRLTTANFEELVHKPSALEDRFGWLPRTIQDAITFVRAIGEQYLWCDALCLVQNDPEDVARGVEVMDLIYEKSLVTIVAACGHDANAGLPGVLEGTRMITRQSEEVTPGVELSYHIGLDQCLKHSPYSSRAWTFQEEVLSRRNVYFVDDKVYYRCRSTTHFENLHPGLELKREKPGRSWASLLPGAVEMGFAARDFAIMLMYYSQRSFTYQSDVLRAMSGIIRRFSDKMKCEFLEGMPTAVFDMFTLFRGPAFFPPLHIRGGFPSYSWSGWSGALRIVELLDTTNPNERDLNKWLREQTWIIWYKRSPAGSLSPVWDTANYSFPFEDLTYAGYRTRRPFQSSHLPSNILTTRTKPSGRQMSPNSQLTTIVRKYNLLQFWTLSVFFKTVIIDPFHGTALVQDDVDGKLCGYLFLDGLEDTKFHQSPDAYELILLSGTLPLFWIKHLESLSDRWTDAGLELESHSYSIMVLEWIGDVAERRGIGFILQPSIAHSCGPGPMWKEIVLG